MNTTVHFAETSDGWRVALTRWRAEGARPRPPVILCHGFSSNRHAFDFAPYASLAGHLASSGRDAWCLELRGYGLSLPLAPRWDFDDFVERDLPAARALVERETGEAPHFIGHSMGGIVLMAYLASGGQGLRSGAALGSSLDYSNSNSGFKSITPLRPLARLLRRLPVRAVSRLEPLVAPFTRRLDEFYVWPENVDMRDFRAFMHRGLENPSIGTALQLATGFEPGGLKTADGSRRYSDGLSRVRTPVLIAAGDKDRQCPIDAARATYDALGGPKSLALFGKAHGHVEHYGHVDLIAGLRARIEVYPALERWLERADTLAAVSP